MNLREGSINVSDHGMWSMFTKNMKATMDRKTGIRYKTYLVLRWLFPLAAVSSFIGLPFLAANLVLVTAEHAEGLAATMAEITGGATLLLLFFLYEKMATASKRFHHYLRTFEGVTELLTESPDDLFGHDYLPELFEISDRYLRRIGEQVNEAHHQLESPHKMSDGDFEERMQFLKATHKGFHARRLVNDPDPYSYLKSKQAQ